MMVPVVGPEEVGPEEVGPEEVGPEEVGTEEIGPEVVSGEITFAGAVGLPDGGVTASAAARLTVPVFVIEEFLAAVCCGFVVSKSEMSAD